MIPFALLIQVTADYLMSLFEQSTTWVIPNGLWMPPCPSAATGNTILWCIVPHTSRSYIKQLMEGSSSSGPGSSARMQFMKLFVILIQVVNLCKRYLKSNDVGLLPLLCLCFIDMLCKLSVPLCFLLLLNADAKKTHTLMKWLSQRRSRLLLKKSKKERSQIIQLTRISKV